LENQGALETLAPGASLTYEVEWRFAPVDPGLQTDQISPELLEAIDTLLERARPRDPQDQL
jgi:hypothetical protein